MIVRKPARPLAAVPFILLDTAMVVAFVVIGRASHERDLTRMLGTTLWPFLLALVVGWLVTRAWTAPTAPVRTGVPVWAVTAVGGMLVRWVSAQGMQTTFVIVGAGFLLLFLVGWRVIAALVRRRQPPSS